MTTLLLSIAFSLVQTNADLYPTQPDEVITIWPGDVPNALPDHEVEGVMELRERDGMLIAKDITEPEMLVMFPDKGKANGGAVLIFPGGGYWILAMDHEGFQYADFVRELGFIAIIVKNRLPVPGTMIDPSIGALMDGMEAVRIARSKAEAWDLDPSRIGVMGSSAGGHLAATVSTCYDWQLPTRYPGLSARPDFSILVYPVIDMAGPYGHGGSRKRLFPENPNPEAVKSLSPNLNVSKDTPPAFLVHSIDDKGVPYQNSLVYLEALRVAGVPGECHIYADGGHGYGLGRADTSTVNWPDALSSWLVQFSSSQP